MIILLEAKEYGKKLGSKELYDAVLNYEVTNTKELDYYLTHHKKKYFYIYPQIENINCYKK